MREIVAVNPRGKKRSKRTMAKKKRTYKKRRNPSRAGGTYVLGMSAKVMLKMMLALVGGLFAGAFSAKNFDMDDTKGGLSQDWDVWNYLLCLLGAFGAGIIGWLIGGKKAMAYALMGGGLLDIYMLASKTGAGHSDFFQKYLGQTSNMGWMNAKPGDRWDYGDGRQAILDGTGNWRPYMGSGYQGDLVRARLGGLVPASLGQDNVVPMRQGTKSADYARYARSRYRRHF